MSEERFSRRFGHGPEEREITIREDAPDEVRGAILKMAEGDLSLSPSYLRDVLCTVLRQLPDRSNWSEYPNVWNECQHLTARPDGRNQTRGILRPGLRLGRSRVSHGRGNQDHDGHQVACWDRDG